MKKLSIILCMIFILSSCMGEKKSIEQAKKELLGGQDYITQSSSSSGGEKQEKQETPLQKETSMVQIIPLDANSPLEFNAIDEKAVTTGEVTISGKIHDGVIVDKIQVLFSNATSNYPDDSYVLQKFKKGDSTFTYMASSKHQVLDFGQNEYIFRAYSGEVKNETKIIINVPYDHTDEATGVETDILGTQENTLQIAFPTSSKYGEPIKLGEASFTYSGVKGFEAKKEVFTAPKCENLTEFLTEKMTSWYYWNTCRDIVKDYGIKFNVLRLDGEKYIYERHYIDAKHGLYATYELETGTGISKENIAEKNTEFKTREFLSLEVVDDLMKDIVKS